MWGLPAQVLPYAGCVPKPQPCLGEGSGCRGGHVPGRTGGRCSGLGPRPLQQPCPFSGSLELSCWDFVFNPTVSESKGRGEGSQACGCAVSPLQAWCSPRPWAGTVGRGGGSPLGGTRLPPGRGFPRGCLAPAISRCPVVSQSLVQVQGQVSPPPCALPALLGAKDSEALTPETLLSTKKVVLSLPHLLRKDRWPQPCGTCGK